MFTSINNIAVALSDAMDFEVSLSTTTAAMSLYSATAAATTTAATTTAATTTPATTIAVTTYTPSSNISTGSGDASPGTFSSETLSQLSRGFWPIDLSDRNKKLWRLLLESSPP